MFSGMFFGLSPLLVQFTHLLALGDIPGGIDEGCAADVDSARVGIAAVVQQANCGFQGAADRR